MQLNLSKYKNKGLVGLENLGNTCFLNSCIQVINNTIELNCLFDDDGYKSHIKDDLPESTIINEWEDLRKVMWSGNGVVAPRKFVNSVQTIAKKKAETAKPKISEKETSESKTKALAKEKKTGTKASTVKQREDAKVTTPKKKVVTKKKTKAVKTPTEEKSALKAKSSTKKTKEK